MAYLVYKPAKTGRSGEIVSSAKFDCGNSESGDLIISEDYKNAVCYNTAGEAMKRSAKMGLGFRIIEFHP